MHEVKLISPQFVKPFVKTNKNDQNDVEGICEAASTGKAGIITIKLLRTFRGILKSASNDINQMQAFITNAILIVQTVLDVHNKIIYNQ